MADDDDGFEQLAAKLNELVDSFDFTRVGKDKSLGHTLIGVIHDRIIDRMAAEQDPDGNPWEANRGRYGEKKREVGVPIGVGYYGKEGGTGGEMRSEREVQGKVSLAPESVTSTYGWDDETRRKGSWFTRGSSGPGDGEVSGAKNQPPRPFYAFNEEDADAVAEEAGRALDQIIKGEF